MRLKVLILASAFIANPAASQTPTQYFNHPTASTLTGSEVIGPVRQGGADKSITTDMLAPLMGSQLQGTFTPQRNGLVPSTFLINRPTIAPLTTTVATTATTIYPVATATPSGAYFSIRIASATPGAGLTCTGDGGATYGTAAYPQDLHWPAIPGGPMPPGPIVCTATSPATVSAAAD